MAGERTCDVCGALIDVGPGPSRQRYCSQACKNEARRRAHRERVGKDPAEMRRGPERAKKDLAARTRVRQSKEWLLYAELLADGTEVLEHEAAVERLGGGSERLAWEPLLQLERLGLISRERMGGPWQVLPPASAEARKWVADNLAGGSHQRASGPPA